MEKKGEKHQCSLSEKGSSLHRHIFIAICHEMLLGLFLPQLCTVVSHKLKLCARNKSSVKYAGMEATCSMIPQAEIILERNCFKEMFLLMHRKKKKRQKGKKKKKLLNPANLCIKSDLHEISQKTLECSPKGNSYILVHSNNLGQACGARLNNSFVKGLFI